MLKQILFSLELRKRLAGKGVGVAAVHPGIVPTELGRYNALAQLGSYDAGIPLLQLLLRRQYLKTVGQGAATTLCQSHDYCWHLGCSLPRVPAIIIKSTLFNITIIM